MSRGSVQIAPLMKMLDKMSLTLFLLVRRGKCPARRYHSIFMQHHWITFLSILSIVLRDGDMFISAELPESVSCMLIHSNARTSSLLSSMLVCCLLSIKLEDVLIGWSRNLL